MVESGSKSCFVIAPIGEPDSEIRKHSDQVLQHIIRPAVEPLGYVSTRADEIDKPGIITSQVIQHIVDDDLVIADLTDRNPNVFYELALRHAIVKPFVQIIRVGEEIPFDVAGNRTVFIDLHDLDNVAKAKTSIAEQVKALQANPNDLETPISVALDLQRLRQSEDPEQRTIADMLSTISEVRSELSNLVEIVGSRLESRELRRLSARLDEVMALRIPQGRSYFVSSEQSRVIAMRLSGAPGFLVLLSDLKESSPWLYDLGMDAYRSARDGDSAKARRSFQDMVNLITRTQRVLPEYVPEVMEDLKAHFERMLRPARPVARAERDIDDLPF